MARPSRPSRDASRRPWGDGVRTNSWPRKVGDPDPARGPAQSTRTPVMVLGEAGSAVVCATLVRDAQERAQGRPRHAVPRARGPMHGPILLKSNITRQPPGGADTAGPAVD